jgi:hypothetical protein
MKIKTRRGCGSDANSDTSILLIRECKGFACCLLMTEIMILGFFKMTFVPSFVYIKKEKKCE